MNIEDIVHQYNTVYIIGEYIDGLKLSGYLHEHTPSKTQWRIIFGKIVECLEVFHSQGWIQGDTSTSNIKIDKEGNPRIVDFSSVRKIGVEFQPRNDFKKLRRLMAMILNETYESKSDPQSWVYNYLSK